MSDRFVISSDDSDYCPLNQGRNFDRTCDTIINSILREHNMKLDYHGMLKLKMEGMKTILSGLFKQDKLHPNDKILIKNALKLQYD